jgi:methionine biosynthesis protein MetW
MSVESPAVGESTRGLTAANVDPLRYDGHNLDRRESTGLICDMVPIGSRVLDVGCGTGSMSMLVRDTRQATIVGIEINSARAEVARQRGLDVHVGALDAEAAVALGQFDVVLFADVLEHLLDPVAILETAKLSLRPGGAVVASTPNVAHWMVRWNLLRGRFDYQPLGIMDATHLRWFTRSTLQSLLETAGFRMDRYEASAGLWMPEYRKSLPWRWMRHRVKERIVEAGVKRYPGLFGCQHVVKASLQD